MIYGTCAVREDVAEVVRSLGLKTSPASLCCLTLIMYLIFKGLSVSRYTFVRLLSGTIVSYLSTHLLGETPRHPKSRCAETTKKIRKRSWRVPFLAEQVISLFRDTVLYKRDWGLTKTPEPSSFLVSRQTNGKWYLTYCPVIWNPSRSSI